MGTRLVSTPVAGRDRGGQPARDRAVRGAQTELAFRARSLDDTTREVTVNRTEGP